MTQNLAWDSRDQPTRVRRISYAVASRNMNFWISRQMRGEEIRMVRLGEVVGVLYGAPGPEAPSCESKLKEMRHSEIIRPTRK